ncbi:MAG: hypothetical protein RBT59_11515 [Arcobacteraceae bacterium]|jgi:hypothetical protein|nr:hypothetical protein [Arcobacteraceae bacterium]
MLKNEQGIQDIILSKNLEYSENTEKETELPKTTREIPISEFQRKNLELAERKRIRKLKKELKKSNPFISDYEIEKKIGNTPKPPVYSAPVSNDFKEFISKFNKRFKSRHKATTAGQELWDYWRQYYSVPEIQVAVVAAMADTDGNFKWKNEFTPVLFFRIENNGRQIDNIGRYLNRKDLPIKEMLLKKDILGGHND